MSNPEEDAPEGTPLAVKAGAAATAQAALVSVLVALTTALGAIATVLSFWKARDLAGAIFWLRSNDGLQALSAIIAIGGFATIVIRSARRKYREVFLARSAPDSVAYIVGEQLPPSPATRAQTGNTRLVDPVVLHRAPLTVVSAHGIEAAVDIPGDALSFPSADKEA